MKGRNIEYSPEELAWIEAHKQDLRRDAPARFCALFGRDDVTLVNYNSLCKRKGWMTGRTGHYLPEQVPHNKGKKMPFNANSAATRFKAGQLPHNHRGAGHERIDNKDGYIVMIVDEINPWSGAKTRPVHKHRYLWEQINGPVPDGHALKCLDGDKTNTDPSNWEAIPRALLPRLAGMKTGIPYDQSPSALKPTLMAIAKLEHKTREARNG